MSSVSDQIFTTLSANCGVMSKPPAFQFYANDFMDATRFWDANACGLYIRCMCIQWTQGGLPNDMKKLARGVGMDLDEVKDLWETVGPKFDLNDDGLLKNRRLEQVRERQKEVSKKRSKAASKRWDTDANAYANAHAKNMQRKVKEKVEGEIEEGKKEKKNGATSSKEEFDEKFELLWTIFQRHGVKSKAMSYWRKLSPEDRDTILAKAPEYVKHTSGPNAQFRSYLEGWINPANRKWERPLVERTNGHAPPNTIPAGRQDLKTTWD